MRVTMHLVERRRRGLTKFCLKLFACIFTTFSTEQSELSFQNITIKSKQCHKTAKHKRYKCAVFAVNKNINDHSFCSPRFEFCSSCFSFLAYHKKCTAKLSCFSAGFCPQKVTKIRHISNKEFSVKISISDVRGVVTGGAEEMSN